MKPLSASPRFTVSFKCGNEKHVYKLMFPVTVASFTTGKTMTADVFGQRWKSMSSIPIVNQTFDSNGKPISDIMERITADNRLGLKQAQGVDKSPNTLSCAGIFETKTKGREKVGCMMRIESVEGGSKFKIYVRAGSTELTNALAAALAVVLKY